MSKLIQPISEHDHQIGAREFKITVVEYGDYQCPYCKRAHPLVKRLLHDKANDIRFVFRNFPLQRIHPYAMSAALAAEAAAKQNKFWEMHDLLFENQDLFAEGFFRELARKLTIRLDQFQDDFDSDSASSKVNADFKSGVLSGVNRTPSFFIDDHKIELAELSYESLTNAVDNYLSLAHPEARS